MIVALFAAVPPTIVAFAGLVQAMRGAEIGRDNARRIDAGVSKIEEIHKLTNGMSEKLQATARAEGVIQGTRDEKDRDKTNDWQGPEGR